VFAAKASRLEAGGTNAHSKHFHDSVFLLPTAACLMYRQRVPALSFTASGAL
jgi:hypothetical protein